MGSCDSCPKYFVTPAAVLRLSILHLLCFTPPACCVVLLQPSPVVVQPLPSREPALPLHWMSAQDPTGKVYYYHSVTRKTQWEVPTALEDSTVTMDLGTPEHSSVDEVGHVIVR